MGLCVLARFGDRGVLRPISLVGGCTSQRVNFFIILKPNNFSNHCYQRLALLQLTDCLFPKFFYLNSEVVEVLRKERNYEKERFPYTVCNNGVDNNSS